MYTNKKKTGILMWTLLTVVTLIFPAHAQNGVAGGLPTASISVLDSTKDQDSLVGSVRRVRVQSARLELKSGKLLEGPLQLLEITTYGLNGNRIDNASYPVSQPSVGKEDYKYNDRGNIIEMTLRGDDGSILSRENYEYEFDTFGNWRKMVTSLVVFEDGELKHEPVEVTYREIAYYFDDSVAKIIKPVSPAIILPQASPKFPELSFTLGPELLKVSDRPPSIEVGADPPGLSKPTDSTAGPVAISLTPANNISASASRGMVAAPKENASGLPSAHKGAVSYYEKGREYFSLGALNEAVDSYRRSLELEPRSAEVYLSLGEAYLKLKNNQEAGKAFKQAILLNPEMTEAHYGLGLHYFAVGRYKNAVDSFKRATVLRPDMAKAHYGLALAYQELGQLDDLTREFRILENIDRGLARKLSETAPEFNLPCRGSHVCK